VRNWYAAISACYYLEFLSHLHTWSHEVPLVVFSSTLRTPPSHLRSAISQRNRSPILRLHNGPKGKTLASCSSSWTKAGCVVCIIFLRGPILLCQWHGVLALQMRLIKHHYRTIVNEAAAASPKQPIINMGQGFFGYNPPPFIINAAKQALDQVDCNQYSPTRGRPRLKKAIANSYSPFWGRQLNPDTEITITTGANEGTSNRNSCRRRPY
jgi:hypothetical protein